jgi:hypothetical protein
MISDLFDDGIRHDCDSRGTKRRGYLSPYSLEASRHSPRCRQLLLLSIPGSIRTTHSQSTEIALARLVWSDVSENRGGR